MRNMILLTAALVTAGTASAADNGVYLGGSLGQANVEADIEAFGMAVDEFDSDDTAYKLIAGIRPLDWLGAEASYVDFGEPDDTVLGTRVDAEADGLSAFGIGFLEVGPVDLFGKAGLINWDTEFAGIDDDGTDFAYGVGAQFRLLSFSVRAEYEVFDLENVDDLSLLSVGLTYTFL